MASVLVTGADDDAARLSALATAITTLIAEQSWHAVELMAWLDVWNAALAEAPNAAVGRDIIDVLRRELEGDATARLSLAPELRDVVPRPQVKT